ncbi:MAG: hypothetical protein KF835_13840 [Xanthobacteraceae bacterium]|nr:hypothetical protein [Xanthobacteraceae bacterium]
MTRAYGFVFGAAVALAGAYFTRAAGGIQFWLFVIGAVGFIIAAAGQLFKTTQDKG